MTYSEYRIPVKITYIGGGSLNWALTLMSDLAADSQLAAEVRLYDCDMSAALRNERIGSRFAEVSVGTPARYRAVSNLPEALEGADIVVISILPGRFEDMAKDLDIPLRYGVPQSVGDTVGPGGFMRALRAVPTFLEIGKAIKAHAPEAFVCNLTNPMSVLTGALYAAFPGIRCWGECHEVTKIRKIAAFIANRDRPERLFSFRDVDVNVLGINHLTFVDRISVAGRDLMPAYAQFAAHHRDTGWCEVDPAPEDEHARYFEDRNRVKFDLMRRFGLPAAAGDRHLAEFFPVNEYLGAHAVWQFGLTPVDYRIRHQAHRREIAEAIASGDREPEIIRSDEALVDQIAALLGGKPFTANANLPNAGQLSGFDHGAIVETNVLFSAGKLTPVKAGRLPTDLEEIIVEHSRRQTALVRALVEEDYRGLFAIFRGDPLLRQVPDRDAAAMYRDMLASTAHLLPAGLLQEAA
ncbi:alpha-glucosidase/alpha-galactosidase [Roseibium aquae]|uniref:Alpha-glucosidase/alpha-galactosidase n=1 Tax=Roseibium aquae TaxID=1323746 RepID=A0A916X1D5_9HYPH|nr:alpha-galactosidase [Roseibium aquae]GGB46695.1 alpha-glucosidase/alpha-galactosidase [Roseibium aquae]